MNAAWQNVMHKYYILQYDGTLICTMMQSDTVLEGCKEQAWM